MLSAEQIQNNLATFYATIEKHISEPRATKLLALYQSQEDLLAMAPASSRASFHNSFPGGYVAHVNNVVEAALKIADLWMDLGAAKTFTTEELVFSALNHDLGKLGMFGKPRYIPNDSEWHVKNQGANYKPNAELPFLPVQDNSLFILQNEGIQLSVNEYIAIKIHDGLYDDGNKAFLISGNNDSKLRTTLPLILHQADLAASRIEWEVEHLAKVGVTAVTKAKTISKPAAQAEAMKRVSSSNPGLMAALKNI
jgi:hypothetical protein